MTNNETRQIEKHSTQWAGTPPIRNRYASRARIAIPLHVGCIGTLYAAFAVYHGCPTSAWWWWPTMLVLGGATFGLLIASIMCWVLLDCEIETEEP